MEGSAGEVSKLEEELISCRLNEVDTIARLQDTEARLREMELQARSGRHQLGRQDQIVRRLQEELEHQRRKQSEMETQLREADIKRSNMEGKLKVEHDTPYIIQAQSLCQHISLRQQLNLEIHGSIKTVKF